MKKISFFTENFHENNATSILTGRKTERKHSKRKTNRKKISFSPENIHAKNYASILTDKTERKQGKRKTNRKTKLIGSFSNPCTVLVGFFNFFLSTSHPQ